MRYLFATISAAAISLSACKSTDPEKAGEDSSNPESKGGAERFVIRDRAQRLRVDGRLKAGRMNGPWTFFDAKGERLAAVGYRDDQRHGLIQVYYVSTDGPAVGRMKMSGTYAMGLLNGFARSSWPSGSQKLEREFDLGILQAARGFNEDGTRMSDGAAMKAALTESREEEAMLLEWENFVQLQMRRRAAEKARQNPSAELPALRPPGKSDFQPAAAPRRQIPPPPPEAKAGEQEFPPLLPDDGPAPSSELSSPPLNPADDPLPSQ